MSGAVLLLLHAADNNNDLYTSLSGARPQVVYGLAAKNKPLMTMDPAMESGGWPNIPSDICMPCHPSSADSASVSRFYSRLVNSQQPERAAEAGEEENPIISTGRSIIYFALKIIRKLFSIHRTGGGGCSSLASWLTALSGPTRSVLVWLLDLLDGCGLLMMLLSWWRQQRKRI